MAKHFVMVLNDDETYTNLDGCSILCFDEEPTDAMVKNPDSTANLVCTFVKGTKGVEINTWKELTPGSIVIDRVWDH